MLDKIKKNAPRYLLSSVVTFLAGFLLALVPYLQDWEKFNLDAGFFIGTLMVAVRAGVKLTIEYIIPHILELAKWLRSLAK